MWSDLAARAAVVSDWLSEQMFRARSPGGRLAFADPRPTATAIARARALGLDFLKRAQGRDGSWSDFLLPPGASVEWITAHTALVLEDVPEARGLTTRAAHYLSAVGVEDGGWGYNRRVADDCDSTAQALMVLHGHGLAAPIEAVAWMLAAQAPSGGFPTYAPTAGDAPSNGWQTEHADVTLMVIEALRRLGTGERPRRRALGWLESMTPAPVVPCYWWPTSSYAAWAQMRAGFRAERAAEHAAAQLKHHQSAPELPMLLVAAADAGRLSREDAHRAATLLLAEQLTDGSWPCDPYLRLTAPAAQASSTSGDGRIFAGSRRVFSTAHSITALDRLAATLAEPWQSKPA